MCDTNLHYKDCSKIHSAGCSQIGKLLVNLLQPASLYTKGVRTENNAAKILIHVQLHVWGVLNLGLSNSNLKKSISPKPLKVAWFRP